MTGGLARKLLFAINSLFALALILGYLLPYVAPQVSRNLSVSALFLPLLIGLNFCFFLFWLFRLKRYVFLSLLVLALGANHIRALFQFPTSPDTGDEHSFKVMSYNVRLFNRYHWLDEDSIPQKISGFIGEEAPDVIAFQEFTVENKVDLSSYDYRYVQFKSGQFGQALYSKWPIVKTGNLDFPDTYNNAVYADIAMGKDTLRVFNLHLESLGVDLDKELTWNLKKNKALSKKIGLAFQRQEQQMDEVMRHIEASPYRIVLLGDINNTASSYLYRQLTSRFKDTFKEKGAYFGRTFDLKGFPLRIDMILVDLDVKVLAHKNYNVHLSDHYPVMAELQIRRD